jgi:hypothetical protein
MPLMSGGGGRWLFTSIELLSTSFYTIGPLILHPTFAKNISTTSTMAS